VAAVDELELPALEVLSPSLTGPELHAQLDELRGRHWVARAEPIGYVILEREAAAHFLRAREASFPALQMLAVHGVTDGPLPSMLSRNLLALGGEDHRRQRKLVQPAFTPAAADRHRPACRRHLEALFEPIAAAGRCEFVDSFAAHYPGRVIAEVIGAPIEDAGRLAHWANLIQSQFDPVKLATIRGQLERAYVEFVEYAWALVQSRRGDPREDLLSELLSFEEEGDRLSEEEVVSLTGAVLVGGVDTTQAQLSHALLLFAGHPDQWRLLAEDPSLAPGAVEEVLRFEPITPFTARIADEEMTYDGVTFPQGSLIFAAVASANRDPAAHEAPERFDITAEREAKPLTFGAGPHFCLGANLARVELAEALVFLAERMPDLELDGEPVYDTPLGIYGVKKLPLHWTGA